MRFYDACRNETVTISDIYESWKYDRIENPDISEGFMILIADIMEAMFNGVNDLMLPDYTDAEQHAIFDRICKLLRNKKQKEA